MIKKAYQLLSSLSLAAWVALAAVVFVGDHLRTYFGASTDALAGTADPKTDVHRNVVEFGEAAAVGSGAAPPAAAAPGRGAQRVRAQTIQVIKGGTGRGFDGLLGKKAEARDEDEESGGEGSLAPAPSRSWFPESFLFDPLVVTDAMGHASVEVPVPDRLTTWRILALAHSRAGAQAGAVTTFLGTLPAYVDPVVPAFLTAGDRIKLPIQLVNTTAHAITLPLQSSAVGGALQGANGPATVPASGQIVRYAELSADAPGVVSLKARFGDADAISRSIPVHPQGRPVVELRGGTLAAPRALQITGASDLLPHATRVRLQVFPGALGLLRSELTAASSRGGVAADGYALLLAGRAQGLLTALGAKADPVVLRDLSLSAAQRVIRDARAPDVATAVLLGEAALAHPENPVLQRLGARLVAQVADAQRPDGTFEGGEGWTLQRLLVTTAQGVQMVRANTVDEAAKQQAARATVRAEGAFERNLDRIADGYTAAAVLASGAVPSSLRSKLQAVVRKAITAQPNGARVLVPGAHVQRPDGQAPSTAEATALAALALADDPQAPWRADLGAALLGSYDPATGWGDGQTNLVALRAVMALFKDPLPSSVAVALLEDGEPVARGELSGARLGQVATLVADVADASGSHTWTVQATPAVPGLGFALALTGYVPYRPEPMSHGLELAIAEKLNAHVGQPVEVAITAAAPAHTPVRIRQALPAGVTADTRSLDALVAEGTLSAYHAEPGAVVLEVPARDTAAPIHASYEVIPTLAGTLHAAASSIEAAQRPAESYHLPPVVWAID